MKVCLLTETAKLPRRAHTHDAGYDLFADETITLQPGERVGVRTGVSISVPAGYVGLIWEKSGLALKGVQCMGGVIDCGYTGEGKSCVTVVLRLWLSSKVIRLHSCWYNMYI